MQQRFIADAAHQMRTPLTGLKTQAQFAMRENDPQAMRHAMSQIAAGVDRASRLVNQLLTLARTEASVHAEQDKQPLNLEALLKAQISDWVMRAMERSIDLEFEEHGAVQVLGNDFLLREMINNLIDNSLRYTPAGGVVTGRVLRNGDFAILEIEDNGVGIRSKDQSRVFTPYFSKSEGGTGLRPRHR